MLMLAAGTRLGAYEILGQLGAGGMGEVYRARDSRLHRDVALKVLPDFAATDPERRERFRREALAVAALNHPHIVTIYSVEDADTSLFLSMELVEGRSLADVLPPGGMALDRVLTIGIAVAEAVSAAHQKGITHRDLKPANVMLGEGEQAGRIKVLDFGLAKFARQEVVAPATLLPTEATTGPSATAEGRILGTVAYMSPEQAEGRPIDARSDLFSLGVVLYEMATGQRPFTGDTNLSILTSILRDTPRPVTELNPALPRDLGRIIRRALAKDPERRYQSAKDLRNDLEDLKASLDSGELMAPVTQATLPSPSVHQAPEAAPTPSSDLQLVGTLARKHSRALSAAVVILIVVIPLIAMLRRDAQPTSTADPDTSPLAGLQVTQLTTSGNADRATISPDGRYVAYVQQTGDASSLWIRQTSTTSNVQIVAPEPGVTFFGATFTPDGTSVDFVRQPTSTPVWDVWRVPFLGGTPRLLIRDVSSAVAWAPDGQRMAFLRSRVIGTITTELIVAGPDGGDERALASSTESMFIMALPAPWRPNIPPAWSPDGQLIAIAGLNLKNFGGGSVLFVDSRTASTRVVEAQNGSWNGLGWLGPESLVLNQPAQRGAPNQLFRLPYPSGRVLRLTRDPNDYVGISLSSDRNRLVTVRRDRRMDIWVGDAEAVTGSDVVQGVPVPGTFDRLAWSGERLLYGAFIGGRPAIMRVTPGKGNPEEVLIDALTPGVTSDGNTIVYVWSSADSPLRLRTADGNGRQIAELDRWATSDRVVVTPDDRSVLYVSIAGGKLAISMAPIEGGTSAKLADGSNPAVSPDGHSLAFTSADGPPSLLVCDLPGCISPRKIGSVPLETAVAWTPDGSGVAYASDGNVWVQPLRGGTPRQLTSFTDKGSIGSFAWSRDGKRLAITRSSATYDVVLFSGLK